MRVAKLDAGAIGKTKEKAYSKILIKKQGVMGKSAQTVQEYSESDCHHIISIIFLGDPLHYQCTNRPIEDGAIIKRFCSANTQVL